MTTLEANTAYSIEHLLSFAGESIELEGKSVRAYVDPGTIELEEIDGATREIQQVEIVIHSSDDTVETNSRAIVRGKVFYIEEKTPERGFTRLALQRVHA